MELFWWERLRLFWRKRLIAPTSLNLHLLLGRAQIHVCKLIQLQWGYNILTIRLLYNLLSTALVASVIKVPLDLSEHHSALRALLTYLLNTTYTNHRTLICLYDYLLYGPLKHGGPGCSRGTCNGQAIAASASMRDSPSTWMLVRLPVSFKLGMVIEEGWGMLRRINFWSGGEVVRGGVFRGPLWRLMDFQNIVWGWGGSHYVLYVLSFSLRSNCFII
jgi:hypothetical protein